GAYPHIAMEFDSHEAVRSAALAGYGVGVVPFEAVQEEIARGTLVRLQVAGLPEIKRTTCLVQRRGASALPAVENFVRLILSRYGHQHSERPARRAVRH